MTEQLPATLWAQVSVTYMVTKQVAMGKTSHKVGHFFKFHSLSNPSHDETLCRKLHTGRLWYLDAQQDACAMCVLWTAAEGTPDTGRASPDVCHCESSAGTLS
jgi:hypothetical protein